MTDTTKTLHAGGKSYQIASLKAVADTYGNIDRLPKSMKVLLENLARWEDGRSVKAADIRAIVEWQRTGHSEHEIAYRPARTLLQDFTGVPAVVDLAAMRETAVALGADPNKVNPLTPVDLVIDHSVMVDAFGNDMAFQTNVEREFERNGERYRFLKWGQRAFKNFRVVPPGTGICHQVNLEYLAQTVWTGEKDGETWAYPDTLVGTDSHTTMVNGLSVLGWGVGGIEAEAAMLGQPISMRIPDVVGFKITGKLAEGATATDLVLRVTEMLRAKGVVGKFVEFYGEGLDSLSLADRATISNMAPEYGATCGFFPIDEEVLRYLRFTGRDEERVELVEAYAKEQGLWRERDEEMIFSDTLALELSEIEPALAGPKRPQDRIALSKAKDAFLAHHKVVQGDKPLMNPQTVEDGASYELDSGAVVIAAITSCTNTSNPSVMIAAGLLARNAVKKGLSEPHWVKTSLAPGSQVVTDYLERAGLQDDLDALGFHLVGYGCTTCIGNSGPLPEKIAKAIEDGDLNVCAVLSGNRNFEGRVSPHTKSNYLASPPLVVAYALAGRMDIDLLTEPLGTDHDGNAVYMRDIWPSNGEVQATIDSALTPEMFRSRYSNVFEGPQEWKDIAVTGSQLYEWPAESTYIKNPPFFEGLRLNGGDLHDIVGAKALALLGDSITTDHISPAGSIAVQSPAGQYLAEHSVTPRDFNSYGSRRGNHEVMMRGTFANIRIRNLMTPEKEGGYTRYLPTGEVLPIYDAAMRYISDGTPLVVIGGKEYGTGSSRDWAAKGTRLLGVKAVVAESFERIHRSNLIGMGVLPLQFQNGESRESLGLKGDETYSLTGLAGIKPGDQVDMEITFADGATKTVTLLVRIDTEDELDYTKAGGILHFVLQNMARAA